MRKISVAMLAMCLVTIARGEAPTPATPVGVVSNFIQEAIALASNHTELADFPEHAERQGTQSPVEFKKNIKPFAVSFDTNTTAVLTKRRIRPSDCGTNGIYLQFILDDGTHERQAPIDTVTYFPNLKLTLYADVVLWEKASPELKKRLEDLIGRHKAMLQELDKRTVSQVPGDTGCKLADPQH
jgi:hypothetical protein